MSAAGTAAPAVLRAEFAKMRRLRLVPVLVATVGCVVVLACRELLAPGFAADAADPSGPAWDRLLAASALAVRLVGPLVVAVVASRLVDPEHQGRGWLLCRTAGLPAGRLCRAKWVAGGALLVAATAAQSLAVLGAGRLAGIAAAVPAARFLGWTAAVAVVSLVLLAGHLLLAALVPNQLVGLGVGVAGVFVGAVAPALPGWAAAMTPWGHYALVAPAGYRGGELVVTDPSPVPTVAAVLVATVLFAVLTRRLDRREV
ncbi:ABC transporter permease [Pseudonocardia alni]|uniref:ABC transporter permease n=1 Tax=Pseudonocardia alni TaxID=33907 RepID=UPI001AD683EA|nr:ABC transporter permease [Pseudonocardia alni]